MKKLATLVSGLMMAVVVSACGTAGVEDVNDRRVYDVNNYDYRGLDVAPYGTNVDDRVIYTRPLKDSPLRNDPEATDNDGRVFDADADDNFIDDEDMNIRPRR